MPNPLHLRLGEHRTLLRQSLELNPFLFESCKVFSELKGDIELTLHLQGDASLRIELDARLVRRAISNLVVNALRHARAHIDVHVVHEGQTIRIDVEDDGLGIQIADRERIFQPFQRLEDERTQRGRGFGLGLAIVRRVAEVSGGRIVALRSDLGGARMRLSLPLHA